MYQAYRKRDPINPMSPRDTNNRIPSKGMILSACAWLLSISLIGHIFILSIPSPAHAICCQCFIGSKGGPKVRCCTNSVDAADCPAYCTGLNVLAKGGSSSSFPPDTCSNQCCENHACYTCPSFGPTGACCEGIACSIRTEVGCGVVGGDYKGNGVPCDPDPCLGAPTGACCVGTDCSIKTEVDCGVDGGDYKGNDVPCDPDPCAQPGSCCNPSTGECAYILEADCTPGWTWTEGQPCDPNLCAQPGSCCNPSTGECTYILEADCTPGWAWTECQPCDPNLFAQPEGACCQNDGTCTVTIQSACTSPSSWTQGSTCDNEACPGACCDIHTAQCTFESASLCDGEYQGLGVTCDPVNPCPDQFHGACLTYGSSYCNDESEASCEANGGSFQGYGSTCEASTGACCASNGTCTEEIFDDCIAGGRTAIGGSCSPDLCAQFKEAVAVPIMTEWGMIGFTILAGLLAALILKRRRI